MNWMLKLNYSIETSPALVSSFLISFGFFTEWIVLALEALASNFTKAWTVVSLALVACAKTSLANNSEASISLALEALVSNFRVFPFILI